MGDSSADPGSSPSIFSRLRLDLRPLRTSRDYRLLTVSGLVTYLGTMVTFVALPYQIKQLTNSYLAVGLMGMAELVPMVVFGLYGGALADSLDRRKMVLASEATALLLSATLLTNALLPNPHLWLLYLVAALFAAVDGLQRPSLEAIIPRIIPHDQLAAAGALNSLRWQAGMVVGPSIAGVVIAGWGVQGAYLLDVATFVVSLGLLSRLRPVPPVPEAGRPSLESIREGLRYAGSRPDLVGTYVVDIAAMVLAMPIALFPFLADSIGGPRYLGMVYAAPTVGSLIATLTSGWTSHYHRHGRAVCLAAAGWGLAIMGAGLTSDRRIVLGCLVLAGAADMVSGLFRGLIWNQTIPDELRGRLAGIELLSYSLGPILGQVRSGAFAAWGGLRFALVSGGVLCVGSVGALAATLRDFWRYDSRTNPYAVAERERRALRSAEPEQGHGEG